MGAGVKSILRIMDLSQAGHLPWGADICDMGTTQLHGEGALDAARSMIRYYRKRAPQNTELPTVSDNDLAAITDGGFLGELLKLAGFQYTALDIFNAPHTILFDLNRHAPGPELENRFDLVLNFGTTEHVFNQVNAFRTIHQLTKVGGVMHHDLPAAGYLSHGFFRYDPLFFTLLAKENHYRTYRMSFSQGAETTIPTDCTSLGLPPGTVQNIGLEAILIKTRQAPLHIPLEQSTSLVVEKMPENMVDYVHVIPAEQSEGCIQYCTEPGWMERTLMSAKRLIHRLLG